MASKDRPGGNSGLSSIGVMGPGTGCHFSFLQATLNCDRVALISGCDESALGM